jgi:hypothetical protein
MRLTKEQYFKSIEQVSIDSGFDITQSLAIHAIQPSKASKRAPKDLKIDTEKRPINDAGELTPDSMSSRVDDSGIAGMDDVIEEDVVFEPMSARIVEAAA